MKEPFAFIIHPTPPERRTTSHRYDSFTLEKELQLSQVLPIDRIAKRHGFKLGGFRSFERAISETEIHQTRSLAQLANDIPLQSLSLISVPESLHMKEIDL